MRRSATITLHWASSVSLMLVIAAGPQSVLAWIFGFTGLAMCAVAAICGLMNGPGPVLDGALRRAHPWMSRAMYLALGVTAAATLWHVAVSPVDGVARLHVFLLSAAMLHAIFHLWRHTALFDGALRRITPTSMHGML